MGEGGREREWQVLDVCEGGHKQCHSNPNVYLFRVTLLTVIIYFSSPFPLSTKQQTNKPPEPKPSS
jgi:hypothetical protein